MSLTYTLSQSATAGDRLKYVDTAAIQLSTGATAFLSYDPDTSSVRLYACADHNTPTLVATLVTGTGGFWLPTSGPTNQALMLCRDAADNLYVVGRDFASSALIAVQAFVKTAGSLAWTPKARVTGSLPNSYRGGVATWCSTGGGTSGAGHLMVAVLGTTYYTYLILDAGVALAASGTLVASSALQPSFLYTGSVGSGISPNIDISNDGFGTPYGAAISPYGGTAGYWSVSSTGTLATSRSMTGMSLISTNTASKVRLVHYAPDRWAAVGKYTTGTQFVVQTLSSTKVLTTAASTSDLVTPVRSAPTDFLSWDVSAASTLPGVVWLYTASTAGNHVDLVSLNVNNDVRPSWGSAVWYLPVPNAALGTQVSSIRTIAEPVSSPRDWHASAQMPGDATTALVSFTDADPTTYSGSAKYTLSLSTTAGDRLLPVSDAQVTLSDGSTAFLAQDNAGGVNLLWTENRTSVWNIGPIAIGTGGFANPATSLRTLSLCRDASDNLYVAGPSQADPRNIMLQAFARDAGTRSWLPRPKMVTAYAYSGNVTATQILWANTGGGTAHAGHLLVAGMSATSVRWVTINDAGLVLSGTGSPQTYAGQPTFFGGSTAYASTQTAYSLSQDGFGAPQGISVFTTGTSATLGAWGVSSSGVLSTNVSRATFSGVSTITPNSRIRLLRYGPTTWALIAPTATAGQLGVWVLSDTALVTSGAAPSAVVFDTSGQAWDAVLTPGLSQHITLFYPTMTPDGTASIRSVACGFMSGSNTPSWGDPSPLVAGYNTAIPTTLRASSVPQGNRVDLWFSAPTVAGAVALYGDVRDMGSPTTLSTSLSGTVRVSGTLSGVHLSTHALSAMTGRIRVAGRLDFASINRPVLTFPLTGQIRIESYLVPAFRDRDQAYPPFSFTGFAATNPGGADPFQSALVSGGGGVTPTNLGWQRVNMSFSVPDNARYVGLGAELVNVPVGSPSAAQLLTGFQVEKVIDGKVAPSPFRAARNLDMYVNPTRLNYAQNPNFYNGTLAGWTADTDVVLGLDDLLTWSGPYVGRVTVPASASSQGSDVQKVTLTVPDLKPGETYTISTHVYMDDDAANVFLRHLASPAVAGVDYRAAEPDTSTYGSNSVFKLLSLTFVAQSSTEQIALCMRATDKSAGGSTRYRFGGTLVEKSSTVGLYFDGYFGSEFMWESGGTDGSSRSFFYDQLTRKRRLLDEILMENTPVGVKPPTAIYARMPLN